MGSIPEERPEDELLLPGERIMTKLEINYQKALNKAKEDEMIEACLRQCICPVCGEVLNYQSSGYTRYMSMYSYECSHCNYKAIRYK